MNKAIHGAVRRDISRFLDALDRFTDGDRTRAQQLATAWANFNDQLTHHHEGEHETAWPALKAVGVDPDLTKQMDDEHDRLATAPGLVRCSHCGSQELRVRCRRRRRPRGDRNAAGRRRRTP